MVTSNELNARSEIARAIWVITPHAITVDTIDPDILPVIDPEASPHLQVTDFEPEGC